MTNSSDTYWSIDGVSLQTYAYNISTWGGDAQSPPPMRGDDTIIPYAVGETWHRKVPGARTISFGMWVIGANEDGTIPVGGSSRRLFEENWKKLRSLMWNPNRQLTLTKRFRNWETGEVITASAKAQFAGGLTPTMNGSQRAMFTVQFKLTDPFFYGDEQTVSINAVTEVARNYAKNPIPVNILNGYALVAEAGTSLGDIEVVRLGTGQSPWAEAYYLNAPSNATGGISYGSSDDSHELRVIPGHSVKISLLFRTELANVYDVKIQYYTSAGAPVSSATLQSSVSLAASSGAMLGTYTVTPPANSARAVISVVIASSGTPARGNSLNRATNPNFSSVGGTNPLMTNVFTNPSFEGYSSTIPEVEIARNIFKNSTLAQTGTRRIVTNYIKNPKFANTSFGGKLGWFSNLEADPGVPARPLTLTAGGPVGGTCMQFTSLNTNGGLTTRYVSSNASGTVRAQSGTSDGVERGPVGDYFGSAWVRSASGSNSLRMRLIEVRPDGSIVKTTTSSLLSIGTTWTRMFVQAFKDEPTSTLHVEIRVEQSGTRTFYVSGVMLTDSNAFAGYYDGDGYLQVPTGRADASNFPAPEVSWKGTRNGSSSEISMILPAGVAMTSSSLVYTTVLPRTIAGVRHTDRVMNIVRPDRTISSTVDVDAGVGIYTVQPGDVGKTLTITAEMEVPDGYNGSADSAAGDATPSRSIFIIDRADLGRSQGPSTSGVHIVRAVITPDEAGQVIRLSGGGNFYAPIGWKTITVVRGTYTGPPFSGEKRPIAGDYPWSDGFPAWTGAAALSDSVLKMDRPRGIRSWNPSVAAFMSTAEVIYGSRTLQILRTEDATPASAARGVWTESTLPAGTYTVAAVGTIPVGYDSSTDMQIQGFRARSIYSSESIDDSYVTLPDTPGTYTVSVTLTLATPGHINLGGGGLKGQSVYWDMLTIVSGDKDITPFSGLQGTDSSLVYAWNGAANNSSSTALGRSVVGVESPVNNAVASSMNIGGTDRSAVAVLNIDKNPDTNYVTFTGIDELFAFNSTDYESYTVMLYVRPEDLDYDAELDEDRRRLELELQDGTVLLSDQFAIDSDTTIRWKFAKPSSPPSQLTLRVGHSEGTVKFTNFAVIPGDYDGNFFSGSYLNASWLGLANASMSTLRGDKFAMTQVFVVDSSYVGPYFDGNTPDTGVGDDIKVYDWTGTPYDSESTYSIVNLDGVDIEVDGEFYTRHIKVVATPPVGSYTITNQTADLEPQGYKYSRGVTGTVTVDVDKFTVTESNSPGDKAYALDPTTEGYWLELAPGTNHLLLRGVGAGKLDIKYRPAWL